MGRDHIFPFLPTLDSNHSTNTVQSTLRCPERKTCLSTRLSPPGSLPKRPAVRRGIQPHKRLGAWVKKREAWGSQAGGQGWESCQMGMTALHRRQRQRCRETGRWASGWVNTLLEGEGALPGTPGPLCHAPSTILPTPPVLHATIPRKLALLAITKDPANWCQLNEPENGL